MEKNYKNRLPHRTNTHIITCRSKHFLISSCQHFHKKSNTNNAFSYRFPIDANLSFGFISKWGCSVMAWALVGRNLSRCAVCGNYLLHRSAVGNRYLHPGCQTIGFPLLTLSDIRWSSVVCEVVYIRHTHTKSVMCVVFLLANMRKGQKCHLVSHGCLLKVARYVTTGDKVKEDPGRWQPLCHIVILSSVTKRGNVVPSQKAN